MVSKTTQNLINNILAMNSEMDSIKNICDITMDKVKTISEMAKHSEDPEFETEVKKFENFVNGVTNGNNNTSS